MLISSLSTKQIITILISVSGFLPSRDNPMYQSVVTIPNAIQKFYPLPEQEMTLSYSRGQSYLASGKFDEALIEFKRAIDIKPNVQDFYYSKGICEEKLNLWNDAIGDYSKAIEISRKNFFSRDDPYLFNNLANAEEGKGDYNQALIDFTYAASLDSTFEAPQLNRALVLFQLGKIDESLLYFEDLHKKYPNYSDGNAVLALIIQDTDHERAKELWKEVIIQDSRYGDLDWIKNIRRWPPNLVESFIRFQKT